MNISNDELSLLINLGIVAVIVLIAYLIVAIIQTFIQILSPRQTPPKDKVLVTLKPHPEPSSGKAPQTFLTKVKDKEVKEPVVKEESTPPVVDTILKPKLKPKKEKTPKSKDDSEGNIPFS